MLLVAAVAAALAARPAHAEEDGRAVGSGATARRWRLTALTFAFADDFLGLPRTRLSDDNGFVASLRLGVELSDGARERVWLVASEQLITERGGLQRVDEGRLYAWWLHGPAAPGERGVTVGWMTGVQMVGNLGGGLLQNWAHQSVFTGRVLGGSGQRRLQDRYPSGTDVLGIGGALLRALQPVAGGWSLRAGAEAAFAAGAGLFGELHPYAGIGYATEHLELELREGAALYGTTVRSLTMPGAYETRVLGNQASARLTLVGPRWLPLLLSAAMEWSRGNTRQHVGEIAIGARF